MFGVFGILRTEIALLLRCTYNKGYLAMASWKSLKAPCWLCQMECLFLKGDNVRCAMYV